jgi:hypothetical protein
MEASEGIANKHRIEIRKKNWRFVSIEYPIRKGSEILSVGKHQIVANSNGGKHLGSIL